MVKWAVKLSSPKGGLKTKHASTSPKGAAAVTSDALKEQRIAGKVYVEFTSGEVYAGGDRVSVLFNGGIGHGYLDVTDKNIHVLLETNEAISTLSVIPICEISMIQLVYKAVEEDPNVCIRTAEFVITTKCSPHRLFRFKLKELEYRSVVVEKICQVAKKKFPVMHVESVAIDQVFQSRVFDGSSDEETLPDGGSETESSGREEAEAG